MSIFLKPVDASNSWDIDMLYKLLAERSPMQSISHKKMPAHGEHKRFVKSNPYMAWHLILTDEISPDVVGSVYLTHNNELGIFIFRHHHGKGYGEQAIKEMMSRYEGPFLANVNPNNGPSRAFFEKLGGKLLQITYKLGD